MVDLRDVRTSSPRLHPDLIPRTRLLETIEGAGPTDVVTVIAPAGYGKTTLVAQWAETTLRPTAWLTLGREHNAPERLVTDISAALIKVGLGAGSKPRRVSRERAMSLGVEALSESLTAVQGDSGVLVLDNAEVLVRRGARDVVDGLVDRLRDGGQLIITSRSDLTVSRTTLRSQGRLTEIDKEDLAMDDEEARGLLAAHDVTDPDQVAHIIEHCEGWPVALHLMALAATSPRWRGDPDALSGGVRFLTDYLSQELIARLPARQQAFLSKTAVLDQFNGPLCDAVLETKGSTEYLRKLEKSSQLIRPIDAAGLWFKVARPLREALRTELTQKAPGEIPAIHHRAARWFEEDGQLDQAIEHARLAGDLDRFARTLLPFMRIGYATGHASVALDWMRWFEGAVTLSDYPTVAAVGSLIFSLEGFGLDADRWLAGSVDEDGVPTHPVGFMTRALATRNGIDQMLDDLSSARTTMGGGSEWLPGALLIEGMGRIWQGDPAGADALLAESITVGAAVGGAVAVNLALGERALIAMNLGDWDGASQYATQAIAGIEDRHLELYAISGLPLVMGARVARHRGDLTRAAALINRAAQVRPKLNSAVPGLAVQTAVEMARAYIELSDVVGARVLLSDASDVLIQRPDLGELGSQVEKLKRTLQEMGPGTLGPSALTKAELRLLPLLATHLTFPEIGERLFISRHTVKTQAMAIYRKLGSSSRSEAVARAQETGLLST